MCLIHCRSATFERNQTMGWLYYFNVVQKFFKSSAKKHKKKEEGEEKCKENWAIFGSVCLVHHYPNFFQIWYVRSVYVEHKICKVGKKPLSSFRDIRS